MMTKRLSALVLFCVLATIWMLSRLSKASPPEKCGIFSEQSISGPSGIAVTRFRDTCEHVVCWTGSSHGPYGYYGNPNSISCIREDER